MKNKELDLKHFSVSTNFATIELDINSIIQKANTAFCQLTGFTSNEIIGKEYTSVLVKDTLTNPILKNLKDNTTLSIETETKHKYLKEFWTLIHIAPKYNDSNKTIGYQLIYFDISDKKKKEKELLLKTEKRQKKIKDSELFLANVSHEFKTPLNAIIGLSGLLSKTELNTKQQELNNNILTTINHLSSLVNDILDYTKIKNQKLTINKKSFLLQSFISNLKTLITPQAVHKNIGINISTDKNLKDQYISDELRITQVLINLASNAIKFTDKGEINIYITLEETNEEFDFVKFSVIDTGKGIHPDKIETIFEKFTQEDDTIESEYGGTGLGLNISKKIVKKLDGQLQATSTIGKGSDFNFTIPLKKVQEKKETPIDFTKINILIAEDFPVNQLILEETLKNINTNFTIVDNGLEAIEALTKNHFDVILMDILMPELDGLETTKHIRKKLKSTIPIIGFSSQETIDEINKCILSGMNDFISKSFDPDELKLTVTKVINSVSTLA